MSQADWLGMSQHHLVQCQDNHWLRPEVCQSFVKMQQAAMRDGIDLQIVSAFRSFERQQGIWDSKWLGKRILYDLQGNTLDYSAMDEVERMYAILTWSALPGGSRHHWGTDLDVYDKTAVTKSGVEFELIAQEYAPSGPCHALHCWLSDHAAEFGFYRPYTEYHGGVAPEAWHLSYQSSAQQIIRRLSLSTLAEAIENSTVKGKKTILAHLDELFQRFTLNGETI